MAASYDSSVLDAALNVIKNNATVLHICSGTPTDRASVLSSSLANVAVGTGDFTGPAAHATSGRQVVVGAKSGVAVTATGTPAHYALISGSVLLALTEVNPSSPGLTSGSTVDIPTVNFSIAAPSVV